jgi:hypothetical protein
MDVITNGVGNRSILNKYYTFFKQVFQIFKTKILSKLFKFFIVIEKPISVTIIFKK